MERLYLEYQSEWLPCGMSIQAYCSKNNVPFKVMDQFIRQIYKKVVEVRVDGRPSEEGNAPSSSPSPSSSSSPSASVVAESVRKCPGRISVSIRFGNGTEVIRRGLDYEGLKSFVGKLDALC